jgi:hypothetical protein
MELLNLR